MAFTSTPLDGSVTPIPMSSAVPDGTNTPLAVEGGPAVVTGGNSLVPVSIYVKDGNDLTQGAQADSAVINPASSGSVIALLKGLLTELIDIEAQTTTTPVISGTVTEANSAAILAALDDGQETMANSQSVTIASDQSAVPVSIQAVSGTALLADQSNTELRTSMYGTLTTSGDTAIATTASGQVKVIANLQVANIALQADQSNTILKTSLYVKKAAAADTVLALGSATSANSLPVAIASDQTVPISHTTVVLLNLASAARATYTSGAIAAGTYVELAFDVNVTALTGGASPTVKFRLGRIGADGILYNLYNPAAISAAGAFTASIGSGLTTSMSFGNSIQIDMVVTGAPTSITFSLSLIGK